MNSFPAVLAANQGLIIVVALALGFSLVLTLIGFIARGAGTSLRFVVFMEVLFAPLALSMLLVELIRARLPATQPANSNGLPLRDGRFADPEKLFGPGITAEQIRDAKAVFPDLVAEAEHAEVGIVGTGETVLVAQFPLAEQGKRAAAYYWKLHKVSGTSGDEERGWRGQRKPSSDYFEMWCTGRHLFVWTALTRDSCAARRAASTVGIDSLAVKPAPREPLIPALQPLGAFLRQPAIKVLGILFLVGLYSVWFFKGAAWASSSPAIAGTQAISAAELSSRLETINAMEVPFRIEKGERANEFFANWRYADAKWVDHARAHGLRRTFRIRLALDESSHTVRATDYVAEYDWSVGRDGARIAWQASLGIVFFQTEQQRVFGLQLDGEGRFRPELSYRYKFNLQEMKSPLIEAVTRAGWGWRPTVWQGPVWLRWLTE